MSDPDQPHHDNYRQKNSKSPIEALCSITSPIDLACSIPKWPLLIHNKEQLTRIVGFRYSRIPI